MRKVFITFILFIILTQFLSSQNKTKNVLILNSYHQGFSWTDKLTNSIIDNLSESSYKINFHIEYLDTKRTQPDSLYFYNLMKLFEIKYNNVSFDLIISTDDDAFFFLLKYRDHLFNTSPVVSCGLGEKNKELISKGYLFFGIYDDLNKEDYFIKSLSIFPQTKQIVFISDQTTTGRSSIVNARKIVSSVTNIKFVFINENGIDDIIRRLNKMPEKTVVYPLIFNYDNSAKFYSHSEFVKILSAAIHFPMIASTEEQIGSGVVGGYVQSGFQQGKITADIALKVLDGNEMKTLSYPTDSLTIAMFDYNYLNRFKIQESSLPAGSIIINRPISFFQQNKTFILIVSAIILIFAVILFIIGFNVKKRKRAEVSLRKLSRAVEQSPVSIIITDTQGIIEYINPKYSQVTGYSFDESIGKNTNMLKSDITAKELYEVLWDTISSGKEWSGEICNRKKNGELFWESVSISPLINSTGKITNYVAVKEDITEKKKDEKALKESRNKLENALVELKLTQRQVLQQERLRSLGQLASGIAHDINNSLMPILGYSDLLLFKKNMDPSVEKKLNSIKTASLDIKRTIERMKDFYKPVIEETDHESEQLNSIILSAIEFTRHRWKDMAESRGTVININTDLAEDLPMIKGNESEIREVLTNLILNSADAMPGGGDLSIKSFPENNDVVVELSDTGIGMNEETLNHCFDPFFTTKGEKGTGLGLSMVYGILQRHNAKIELSSQQGKGTTVKLIFQKDALPMAKIEDKKLAALKPLKLLCIDDNRDARELLNSMLQDEKNRIVMTESGNDGINEFFNSLDSGDPFDVVITDLGMPFMDGKSVSETIKMKSADTPIILITGWGAFIESGSIKNVDYILKKPITVFDLNRALKTVLKLS